MASRGNNGIGLAGTGNYTNTTNSCDRGNPTVRFEATSGGQRSKTDREPDTGSSASVMMKNYEAEHRSNRPWNQHTRSRTWRKKIISLMFLPQWGRMTTQGQWFGKHISRVDTDKWYTNRSWPSIDHKCFEEHLKMEARSVIGKRRLMMEPADRTTVGWEGRLDLHAFDYCFIIQRDLMYLRLTLQ